MSSPSTSSGSLRRSTRTRRPAQTIYDDASEFLSSAEKIQKRRGKRKQPESESESNEDEEMMEIEEPSSSDSEDDSDDEDVSEGEEKVSPSRRKSKSSPSPTGQKRQKVANAKSGTGPRPKAFSAGVKKSTAAAWTSLTKGVLEKDETPDNSTLAALLQSGVGHKGRGNNSKLEELARKLVRDHFQDANVVQVRLCNFLFRVCGATTEAFMPEDVDLESIDPEVLAEYISVVVTSMEGSDLAAEVLWTAAPPTAPVKLEFRSLFQEFFHALGVAALEATASPPKKDAKDSEDESDKDDDAKSSDGAHASMRFQVEVARNIVLRLMILAFLQPDDLRSAVVVALYSFATAVLHKTVELREKLQTAQRQYNLAKRHKQRRKSEALKSQVDTGKRMVEDLEELVKQSVMSVFVKRWKDICPHIRSACMLAFADFAVIRPDIFFERKYLKYPAWTLYDKDAVVREAALVAFLQPCKSFQPEQAIMQKIVSQFAERWADCTIDVDTRVQERAMELMLYFERNHFLDSLDTSNDDAIWDRVNLRALDADTTPTVRKLGLEFVIEQLEAFDDPPDTIASDVAKFSELASWTALNISKNEIPVDQIRFETASYIMQSMRACPELLPLARNFSAMVQALEESLTSKVSHRESTEGRIERTRADVKKRVLLEFIISGVEEEVQLSSPDHVFDPDLKPPELHGKKQKTASAQENLTRVLLPTLPKLLNAFKSETSLLRRLVALPVYFAPTACGSSDQKRNFKKLLSTWSDCFMEASDDMVLKNACHALSFLATADHARRDEAVAVLQDIMEALRKRLDELIAQKVTLVETNDEGDGANGADTLNGISEKVDVSISLQLRRLAVLVKRWPLTDLLEEDDEEAEEEIVDKLCENIFKIATNELCTRKPVMIDDKLKIPEVWKDSDRSHEPALEIVVATLTILLSTAAWGIRKKLIELENSTQPAREKAGTERNPFLIMRERIEVMLSLCFEQFTDENHDFSKEHVRFAEAIQEEAGRFSGDLRSLYPRDWSRSVDPLLREAALVDDNHLIGGYVRFVRSQENKLHVGEGQEGVDPWLARKFLVPMIRGLLPNWGTGNRREAATALSHITQCGPESTAIISTMSKVMKRLDPVRLLEAHMACLRQGFESWAENEPEEPASENPTDEENEAFEEAEKEHEKKFQELEHQAQRLSASLGVGKISDQSLANTMLGFVREGIRFAFSRDAGSEELLFLGARLPFLRILAKYLVWVRKNNQQMTIIRAQFNQMEDELRTHPDYHQVLDYDLGSLDVFRKTGNLGIFVVEDESTVGGRSLAASSRASSRNPSMLRRYSHGGSISSVPSKVSTNRSDLSPLPEEKDEDMEEDEKMPQTPAGNSSMASSRLFSLGSKTGDEDDNSSM